MPAMLTSKITDRSQTTVPRGVRTVLGLEPGQRVGYVIDGNEVKLVNASALDHDDPVVESFLALVGRDIATNPHSLVPFPETLLDRARELTRAIEIDHDAPIEGETAI